MAKRVDPLKAKQAKQKKIAIGLSVLLVAVLAYQGPKTLKMLKGPAPVAAPAVAEPAAATPSVPEAGAVPTPEIGAGAPVADPTQPVILADSDTPVGAGAGQLLSFEQFESNDPFQQQVDLEAAGSSTDPTAPDDDSEPGSDPAPPDDDPAVPGSAENPPISFGGTGSPGSTNSGAPASGSGSTGVVPGGTQASPAPATTISVNGVVHMVTTGTPFPAEEPTFELVSLGADGKSVQIGVAGGDFAGGGETVKLVVGKPLTLQNTADGSRYKLVLLTVEGAAPPNG